jgi:hypothetical protein
MSTKITIEQITKERLEKKSDDFVKYLSETGPEISKLFNNTFDWKNCALEMMVEKCIFLVGIRNGEIRGHMICYVFNSPMDIKVKILNQLSFYVKPDSGRTAYHLFHKFIDIGKDRANHIITMLTTHSNIKPSSLKNLGFEELETLYRLEIK